MGEVYLAEKVGPEGFIKPVVLKCVLPQLASDRSFVQLFLDEARLAALLNHPNIAQIYDFGVVDGVYFMAMEYVPGYTIDDIRRKHTAIGRFLPIEHVACIATQVCQGLHHAHALTDARGVSLGLVHRDVSPHNIMVSIEGTVKIVDFGIAKARAGLTRVQAKGAVGKFGYMSPEQAHDEAVDPRTDVFSLGVCLWELTSNRRMHDVKIDRPPRYDEQPIPPVTSFRRDVPRQFERILETALSVDSARRYASCQDMHLDLERFLAAMTHYAGQAALTTYLRELAAGKMDQPSEIRSRDIVEPANAPPGRPASRPSDAVRLEGAQRYEEVFGVSMERSSPAAPAFPRAVPESWLTRPPSSPGKAPERRSEPPPLYDFKIESIPSAAAVAPRVSRSPPAQRASLPALSKHPTTPRRRMGMLGILVVVLLVLVAAGAFFRESIADFAADLVASVDAPPVDGKLESRYRIRTQPSGAQVVVDGQVKGSTPLELALLPDLEYRFDLKKQGYATKTVRVEAKMDRGIQTLEYSLVGAATLKVTSTPPGAGVTLNGFAVLGKVTPMTLVDIAAGERISVMVSLNGQSPKARDVTLGAGATETLHFELGN